MNIDRLFFPSRCIFCGKVIGFYKAFCDDCIKYSKEPVRYKKLCNGIVCISRFRHEGLARRAMLSFKYNDYRQFYLQYSIILSEVIKNELSDISFDFYTCVPPHKHNAGKLHFYGVRAITVHTAKRNNVVFRETLYESRNIDSQHKLNAAQRRTNVLDAYRVINKDEVRDKTILIFDDIVTTGATLTACTNELLKAGAKKVYCITVNH